jgi:hypothetical protein
MAHYVFLVVNDETFRDQPKAELDRIYAEVTRWSDEMTAKGILKGGSQLAPKRTAMTVRRVNGQMKVFDGPFIESKEHVGGYMMIDVPDLDEAIRVARSFPATIEVRPTVEH